jgi:hypothetical protein
MELNQELVPFIASWTRAGLTEEQIAKRIERHIRLAAKDAGDDVETWRVERAEDDGDTDLLNETDAEPTASSEPEAAIPEGMTVMADPGNEPKQSKLIRPFEKAQVGFDPVLGANLTANQPLNVGTKQAIAALDLMPALRLSELAKLPKPAWLLDKHIPEDGISVVFGPSHSGKSFLVLDMGLCIAAGIPWLGYKTKQGPVAYIYSEQPADLYCRAQGWQIARRQAELPDDFVSIPRAVLISDPAQLALFAVKLKLTFGARPPKLIVIDTLNRCYDGEENSASDMGNFIRACDRLRAEFDGATVVIVHHTGKDEDRGSRGTSAMECAVDSMFQLKRPDIKGPALQLINTKVKRGKELDDQHLRLDERDIGDDETTLSIRRAREDEIVEAVFTVTTAERECLDALASIGRPATYTEWKEAYGKSDQSLSKHRNSLLKKGLIEQLGPTYIPAEPV